MSRASRIRLSIAMLGIAAGLCPPVFAGQPLYGAESWWLEGGLGAAQVSTQSLQLPGQRGAAVLSMGLGYRATRYFGLGLEYASSAALSGCQQWDCRSGSRNFKPGFNRFSAFSELRLLHGKVRLRYGVGNASYCYRGGNGLDLWQMTLEALVDDDDYEYSSCDSANALVQSASVGFHWSWRNGPDEGVAGLRLGVEQAKFGAESAVGIPGFRYRAATLTLQLSLN